MKGLVVVVLCASICQSWAWGEEGHMIIAQIAATRLTSAANKVINMYVGNTGETLPAMAPLPDTYDHTPQGKWSEPCHFCNLPRNATHFTMSDCGQFCVVRSIQNYSSILQSTSNPQVCNFDQADGYEPCALEFLVHFVGDVHQPLHCGYAYDRGGNDVKVKWFEEYTELHAVWDDKIIQRWNTDYSSAANELEEWIANNPSLVKQYLSDMNPVDWADESFQYVRTDVYNYNPQGGDETDASEPYLGTHYYDHNLPIVKERLAAAGVRLAALLNSDLTSALKSMYKNKLGSMKILN